LVDQAAKALKNLRVVDVWFHQHESVKDFSEGLLVVYAKLLAQLAQGSLVVFSTLCENGL
jgi:hypothetical protein